MINKNFYYLLTNTPLTYPICLTEEEAISYLEMIGHPEFLYNNINNYDIIDYEKLIYIEIVYGHNDFIQELLFNIKKSISQGYQIKNQYKNRIIDMPKIIPDKREFFQTEGYFGIPRESEKK